MDKKLKKDMHEAINSNKITKLYANWYLFIIYMYILYIRIYRVYQKPFHAFEN